MTTELATTRTAAINEWDEGFRRLVVQTVLKPKNRDATAAELALLAEQAVRTGLDPMARQIYGIYRYDKRANGEVMTIQVGIDGLRTVAQRTGQYAGGPAPLFAGEDGEWTDLWLKPTPPVAAKVVVRKALNGSVIDSEAVALRSEYMPTTRDGAPMGLWGDKPALMLAKCAEALALRKAFPQDLSGLYTDDEMGRADQKAPPAPLPTPEPEEVVAAEPVELVSEEDAALWLHALTEMGTDGRTVKAWLIASGCESIPRGAKRDDVIAGLDVRQGEAFGTRVLEALAEYRASDVLSVDPEALPTLTELDAEAAVA